MNSTNIERLIEFFESLDKEENHNKIYYLTGSIFSTHKEIEYKDSIKSTYYKLNSANSNYRDVACPHEEISFSYSDYPSIKIPSKALKLIFKENIDVFYKLLLDKNQLECAIQRLMDLLKEEEDDEHED